MDIQDLYEDQHRSQAQRDGRYWGWVAGTVTNVNDAQGLVRVKARIGGQFDQEESDWLLPALPGAIESIPNKGDPCLVGFVDGDPHKGFYLCHPESTTKGRPTEPMVLGITAWGIINYLVTQFNQLRTDFNNHTHPYSGGTGTANLSTGAVTGVSGSTSAPTSPTAAVAANKGKASDGSVIADKSTSEIVLSGKAKVR